jgi:hypothetical protein
MTLVVLLASILLVLVLAVVLVSLIVARRPRPAPPPASPSGLSPDGNWWWNGTQWVPSGRTSLPPVNRPG